MIFDKCILQKEALSISTSWGCSIKFYNNFIQKRILAVLPLSGLERAKVEPEVEFPLHKTPIPAPELLLIGLISISKVFLLENLPTQNQTQEKRKKVDLILVLPNKNLTVMLFVWLLNPFKLGAWFVQS